MGDGAWSAGGYETDYDPAYEGLSDGMWKNEIPVSKMTTRHLRNAIRFCQRASRAETFSCESEKWDEWEYVLHKELQSRTNVKHVRMVEKKPVRGSKVQRTCKCGKKFEARKADVKRGWGKFCSKSCKARF